MSSQVGLTVSEPSIAGELPKEHPLEGTDKPKGKMVGAARDGGMWPDRIGAGIIG